MRVVIIGCGSATIGLEAAIVAAQCQVVTAVNSPFIDRYAVSCRNHEQEYMCIRNEDYAEQTAPNGRSGKAHNIILNMNKKGRKW